MTIEKITIKTCSDSDRAESRLRKEVVEILSSSHRSDRHPNPAIGNTRMKCILIDNTPICLKMEIDNEISRSAKDRLAAETLIYSHLKGEISPITHTILELTSGNTGFALAKSGRYMGYKVVLIMGNNASQERFAALKNLGAEIVEFDASGGYGKGLEVLETMLKENPDTYYCPRQFENRANPEGHFSTTGQEIICQLNCLGIKADGFVCGAGTGGTLAGVSQCLIRCNPEIRLAVALPVNCSGTRIIEGVATTGFESPIYQKFVPTSAKENASKVTSCEAFEMCRRMARDYHIEIGPSSGMNIVAAVRMAKELGSGATLVTMVHDGPALYPASIYA
jgi:cysteine synthase